MVDGAYMITTYGGVCRAEFYPPFSLQNRAVASGKSVSARRCSRKHWCWWQW